jgi:hypothetical protein
MSLQRVIDHDGLGQSGYTAGRARDLALERELVSAYVEYPRDTDDESVNAELGADHRFTGRGGPSAHCGGAQRG